MQRIYINGEQAIFRMGTEEYPCIIDNVDVQKRTIGEAVTTNVYYDIDVIYDKECGLHEVFRHIHGSFVKKIPLNQRGWHSDYFYSEKEGNAWKIFRRDGTHIANIVEDCMFFTNPNAAYGPEDLAEIHQLMKRMAVPT